MVLTKWNNSFPASIVCVDTYNNGELAGRFYNPYLNSGDSFQSLSQFIVKMEQLMDELEYPAVFDEIKNYYSKIATAGYVQPEKKYLSGNLATFILDVRFRQNLSWQGSITWENKRKENFRSVLELILLIDANLGEINEL